MSDSSKEVMEATNNFFEARVAVLGYKCRVLQLEGLLEASREENRRLVGEVQRLNGQLQGWNAGLYRPEIEVHEPSVACDGMSPSELEESILPPPIFHTNQPMPMCGGYDQVQRDSALRRGQPFHDGGLANQQQSSVAVATYPQPRPRQQANGPSYVSSQSQWNGHDNQVMGFGSCPICGKNNFTSIEDLERHSARCTDFR